MFHSDEGNPLVRILPLGREASGRDVSAAELITGLGDGQILLGLVGMKLAASPQMAGYVDAVQVPEITHSIGLKISSSRFDF